MRTHSFRVMLITILRIITRQQIYVCGLLVFVAAYFPIEKDHHFTGNMKDWLLMMFDLRSNTKQ